MANISKFVELSIKKLPHDKKVRCLYGEKDDTNKFFKCWNCGFTVDSEKHPTQDRAGTSFTSFPDWVNLVNEMNEEIVCEDNSTNIIVSADLYYSDISVGCPFCGSPNYR